MSSFLISCCEHSLPLLRYYCVNLSQFKFQLWTDDAHSNFSEKFSSFENFLSKRSRLLITNSSSAQFICMLFIWILILFVLILLNLIRISFTTNDDSERRKIKMKTREYLFRKVRHLRREKKSWKFHQSCDHLRCSWNWEREIFINSEPKVSRH